MIKFVAGLKGQGKTRLLIDTANEHAKTAKGSLVFIDGDNSRIHDLHRDVRLVVAGKSELSNYREFIGFIRGILSQNSDIECIYVDAITNIIKTIDNEALVKLVAKLEGISKEDDVNFTISIHVEPDSLPTEIKDMVEKTGK